MSDIEVICCPRCNYRGKQNTFMRGRKTVGTPEQIERVRKAAEEAGVEALPGGYFREKDVDILLGRGKGWLRKQVNDKRNQLEPIDRNGQRDYDIEDIARFF